MKNAPLLFLIFIFMSFKGAEPSYVINHKHLAINEMKLYGVPASITLAQAMLESTSGTSEAAVKYKNHFGMHCKVSHKHGTDYCAPYIDKESACGIKKYKTVFDSYRDHSRHLRQGKYAFLIKNCGKDYKQWTKALKDKGYAEDPLYESKLNRIIEQHKLYKYDE